MENTQCWSELEVCLKHIVQRKTNAPTNVSWELMEIKRLTAWWLQIQDTCGVKMSLSSFMFLLIRLVLLKVKAGRLKLSHWLLWSFGCFFVWTSKHLLCLFIRKPHHDPHHLSAGFDKCCWNWRLQFVNDIFSVQTWTVLSSLPLTWFCSLFTFYVMIQSEALNQRPKTVDTKLNEDFFLSNSQRFLWKPPKLSFCGVWIYDCDKDQTMTHC